MATSDYENGSPNGAPGDDPQYDTDAERTFWSSLATLYTRRRLIIGVTVGMAVLSVIISLLLPNWYKGSARVVLPAESGGSGLLSSGLMQDLPSAAKSLLGGASGDYVRHLAILNSRSLHEAAVDSFNMVEVYETQDSETPKLDAIGTLQENTEFVIDDEYDYMSIEVLDRDPERAAAMANFFVRALNRFTNSLASESEGSFQQVVETRYLETQARFDSLMSDLQSLQNEYGVMNLEMQAPLFYENIAALRLTAFQAEAQYEQLRSQFGANNTQVQAAREALRTVNAQYQSALQGQEALMPVGISDMPEVARRFYELDVQRRIAATVLEYMRPLVEQARFDELRAVRAVQVVDPAIPPVEDAKPKRMVIVIVATMSAFLLAVIFVLLYAWWERNHSRYAHRMAAAVSSEGRTGGPARTPDASNGSPDASDKNTPERGSIRS